MCRGYALVKNGDDAHKPVVSPRQLSPNSNESTKCKISAQHDCAVNIVILLLLVSLSEGTNVATCSANECKSVTCSWLVYSATHKLHLCLCNFSA